MIEKTSIKVIFDTNVWISFLIGKRLQFILPAIEAHQITVIYSAQLLEELNLVAQRPKLKKYFPEEKVKLLLQYLKQFGLQVEPEEMVQSCRDSKDNFLLDLALAAQADYLVTGDKDLLVLHPFGATQIKTPASFEDEVR